MRKPEVRPLVRLRWVDSANLFLDRWARVEELDDHDAETFCETVGWVVGENDHSVYVAGSVSPEEIGSVMQIPLCAIRSRVTLSPDRPAGPL